MEQIQRYLDWAVRRTVEVGSSALKKEFKNEGFEFIFMVLPYHKTQVSHFSAIQLAELEKSVAQAAQRELQRQIKSRGREREI